MMDDRYADEDFHSDVSVSPRSSYSSVRPSSARSSTARRSGGVKVESSNAGPADLRGAGDILAAANVKKLKDEEVIELKGLSSDAWSKKLDELVSTVKGDKYCRAPVLSVGVDVDVDVDGVVDGSALVAGAGAGTGTGTLTQHAFSSSGSFFSAHPPPTQKQQRDAKRREEEESKKIFLNIQKTIDGAVYGSTVYANKRGSRDSKAGSLGKAVYVMDEPAMQHSIEELRSRARSLELDVESAHREVHLLNDHVDAQNRALDQIAKKKGYIRIGDKPVYEKMSSSTVLASPSKSPSKLSMDEALLTLQIHHKSLKAQKKKLEKQLEEFQDQHGSKQVDSAEEKEAKKLLLAEIHSLQTTLLFDKKRTEQDERDYDAKIASYREDATKAQLTLEGVRKLLQHTQAQAQAAADKKSALVAKVAAITQRLNAALAAVREKQQNNQYEKTTSQL